MQQAAASIPTPPPLAMPVSVLHISGRSDHGGGPEHVRQILAAAIPGLEHHVACPRDGIYWDRYADLVGAGRLCPVPHRRLSLRALLALRGFIRERGIQVVHSHGMSGGVYGRALGTLTGLPVVHSFHGVPVTPGLKHRLYQLVEPLLARATDCGVAVSAGEADIIHGRWRRYRGKLAVVPNGIELAERPAWSAWPPAGPLRIVSFSRRNNQKYPELLIEVARCLALMGVACRIDAYGEGLDHPALAAAVGRRGVADRLAFHPPSDASAALLDGAHVYLSTSRWEGMPLAVLEAWRAGLVVVASDVVGNRDLIEDGRTGRLFRSGNGRQAARIIRDLLSATPEVSAIRKQAAMRSRLGHCRNLMAMRLGWLYQRMAEGAGVLPAEVGSAAGAITDSGIRLASASPGSA